MALPIQTISMDVFGGGNWSDSPPAMIKRAFQFGQGGFSQVAPVESPDLENVDYIERVVGKRKGSAKLDDYSSVLISGDTILKQTAWIIPGGTTEVEIAAGAKGLYTNQSGSWVRLTNANATNFQWNTDSTKISFVPVDNHLVIMSDKNFSQIYRSGTALDDQMHGDPTDVVVDASSSSGQKVLNVDVTTPFNVGDRILIDSVGNAEAGYVASISAGVSVTLEDNLSNTYTNETVDVANLYTESKGGATQAYTGTWTKGHYIGFELHERFCMGTGNNVWEHTDVQEAWDLAGGSFRLAKGNIVAAITFTPKGGSELNTVGFLSTTEGPEIYPGFDPTDSFKPMQGGSTALNHQCITALDNWIIYFTSEGGFEAVNYNQTIDLGRRFKSLDGATGPLDTFTATNSNHTTLPFVYQNVVKKQIWCQYPDGSNSVNTHEAGLDFYLGEPVQGEAQESYETRVRCLYSSIKEPSTNPWFRTAYSKRGSTVGVLATGISYTINSGKNDLDTIPVLSKWQEPDFNGGSSDRSIFWGKALFRFKEVGNWNVIMRKYLDRSTAQTGSDVNLSMIKDGAVYDQSNYDSAVYASGAIITVSSYLDAYSNELRVGIVNENADEDWVLNSLTQEYQIGGSES